MRPGDLKVGGGDKARNIRCREEWVSGLALLPVP